MRFAALAVSALMLTAPLGAVAQDRQQTLADIKQELAVLHVEMQKLNRELSTTGTPSANLGGSSVLDRVTAMEAELTRLTNMAEELQNRVNRVVTDGSNQIDDLAFRLCELETNCDPGKASTQTILGGGTASAELPATGSGQSAQSGTSMITPGVPQPSTGSGSPELAVGEQSDFQAASKALESGDYQTAANLFAGFNQAYPGSPLAAQASLGRGQALDNVGDTREAARAYLASFSADTTGPVAPDALTRLGTALGKLGQRDQACVTLNEVGVRFPGNASVASAQQEMAKLGCS